MEEKEEEESFEESEEEKDSEGIVAQLSSFQKNESLRVCGVLCGQRIVALIDIGSTHNFIDEGVVARRGLKTEDFKGFKVMVANGFTLTCTRKIPQMSIQLGNYEVKDEFYVVSIGDIDAVLGIQWMQFLGEITLNLQTMELRFQFDGKKVALRGMSNGGPRVVTYKRMERLIHHDQVEWTAKCIIMPSVSQEEKREYHLDVQASLTM